MDKKVYEFVRAAIHGLDPTEATLVFNTEEGLDFSIELSREELDDIFGVEEKKENKKIPLGIRLYRQDQTCVSRLEATRQIRFVMPELGLNEALLFIRDGLPADIYIPRDHSLEDVTESLDAGGFAYEVMYKEK